MRLGIVGPGLIWQNKHKQALAKLPQSFTISAFCASTESRKTETAREFPDASFSTNLETFLARSDIDAVVVLAPIHLTSALALRALRSGKDVFVEKPIAHTLEGGRDLVNCARQLRRRVWVLEQEAYNPAWVTLKRILSESVIGEPVYFNQVIHWPLDTGSNDRGGYGKTGWRITPGYPLGLFFDGGHHQVAVLSTLFGAPDWVFATGVRLREEFGEYDHIVMQAGYASPLRGVVSHSGFLGERQNSFTIWGTRGSASVLEDQVVIESRDGARQRIESPRADAHVLMWTALARSSASGGQPPYALEQAAGDLAVLLAVDLSITQGRKVSLSETRVIKDD